MTCRPPNGSMLSHLAAQDITRMLDYRIQCIKPIAHSTRRSRQIDDQRLAAHSSDASSQGRTRKVRQRQHAYSLGDSFRFALDHRPRRFRSDVTLGESRSAGGEHEISGVAVAGMDERSHDLNSFVSAFRRRDEFIFFCLYPAGDDSARGILSFATHDGIRNGDYRYAHTYLRYARSPQPPRPKPPAGSLLLLFTRGASSAPTAILVERHLLHYGGNALSADLYLEWRAFRCRLGRNVRGANRNTQCRAHRPTSHFAARFSIHVHRITVTRERSLRRRESNQLSFDALLFLLRQRITPDEITFFHFNEPSERCFERCCGVVEIVAVERHPHLETQ